jgi:hypothetical protein
MQPDLLGFSCGHPEWLRTNEVEKWVRGLVDNLTHQTPVSGTGIPRRPVPFSPESLIYGTNHFMTGGSNDGKSICTWAAVVE